MRNIRFQKIVTRQRLVSLETGASHRGSEPWNTEVEGSTALEAVTRRQRMKWAYWEDLVCAVVICRVRELEITLQLLVITNFKDPVYPITNSNPVSIFTHLTRQWLSGRSVTRLIIECKRGRSHVTSIDPFHSNGCVYRAVPYQRQSLLDWQFRLSADMRQY
jgi:hypothetical protein